MNQQLHRPINTELLVDGPLEGDNDSVACSSEAGDTIFNYAAVNVKTITVWYYMLI